MSARQLWDRYRAWLCDEPEIGFRVDVSRMGLPPDYPKTMEGRIGAAFDAMEALESGAVANPTEETDVRPGHRVLAEQMQTALEAMHARLQADFDRRHDPEAPVDSAADEALLEALRSLGYIK